MELYLYVTLITINQWKAYFQSYHLYTVIILTKIFANTIKLWEN